jgi:hypothetical protein
MGIAFVVVGAFLAIRPSRSSTNAFSSDSWLSFLFIVVDPPGRHRDVYARIAGVLLMVAGIGLAVAVYVTE